VFDAPDEVIRSLLRYTDWWQPTSTSILLVGAARRSTSVSDGFRAGLLETLDERTELMRRMQTLDDRHRSVLFLWYIKQLPVRDIAKAVKVSRRQCFRLRSKAVRMIVEFDPANAAA
jgi:DNA-directed RNA polymerase specialized sigma24 family protein